MRCLPYFSAGNRHYFWLAADGEHRAVYSDRDGMPYQRLDEYPPDVEAALDAYANNFIEPLRAQSR